MKHEETVRAAGGTPGSGVGAPEDSPVAASAPRSPETRPPEKMKRLTIDVPADLHTRIKIRCVRDGTNMSDAIRELLSERFGSC